MNMYSLTSWAKINREASNTYTFGLRPRTPRIERTHSFLQYSISFRYIAGSAPWGASNTLRAKRWPAVVLFVFFTKFTKSNSISNGSYTKLFYFLVTHRLNYQRNDYFLSKINTTASISRFSSVKMSSIFSRSTKQYTECFLGAWWRSLQTFLQQRTKPHDHVACLFLIFCIHFIALSIILQPLSLCIFTKFWWSTINFKTENGSWLITEYYAFKIRVDQVNFLREKFGVLAYSQDRLVAE